MEQKKRRQKNTFRRLEQMLERVIIGTLVLFLLMLVAAATGIGWLKWVLGLTVVLVSAMGTALLVLKQEHRKRRSWWMLASFIGPLMTDTALSCLSLVGNVLIFGVGVNLVFGKKIKVANYLPALIIAVAWSFFL